MKSKISNVVIAVYLFSHFRIFTFANLFKNKGFIMFCGGIMDYVNYFCRKKSPAGVECMRKLSMDELNRMSVDEFKQSEKIPVIAVLENIRSAYNVGSVFRTADAFLLEAIYICGYTCKPPHKEIKKTALGAEDSVTWKHFENTNLAIQELHELGYRVFAVEQTEGSTMLNAFEFSPEDKIAVIFGNEVTGVEAETIRQSEGCIEIPQFGMKHSLNIATAAGVVLWELVRGRRTP